MFQSSRRRLGGPIIGAGVVILIGSSSKGEFQHHDALHLVTIRSHHNGDLVGFGVQADLNRLLGCLEEWIYHLVFVLVVLAIATIMKDSFQGIHKKTMCENLGKERNFQFCVNDEFARAFPVARNR